jgi:hypothetical protein
MLKHNHTIGCSHSHLPYFRYLAWTSGCRMDTTTIKQHLALAQSNKALSEMHIARQCEIVRDLLLKGRDNTEALRLLGNLIDMQTIRLAYIDRLQHRLNAPSPKQSSMLLGA